MIVAELIKELEKMPQHYDAVFETAHASSQDFLIWEDEITKKVYIKSCISYAYLRDL